MYPQLLKILHSNKHLYCIVYQPLLVFFYSLSGHIIIYIFQHDQFLILGIMISFSVRNISHISVEINQIQHLLMLNIIMNNVIILSHYFIINVDTCKCLQQVICQVVPRYVAVEFLHV
jgi:hypothetical protein